MKNRKVFQKYSIVTPNGQEFNIDHYKVNNYYTCDIYRYNNSKQVFQWYQSFNSDIKNQLFQSIDGNVKYLKGLYK